MFCEISLLQSVCLCACTVYMQVNVMYRYMAEAYMAYAPRATKHAELGCQCMGVKSVNIYL